MRRIGKFKITDIDFEISGKVDRVDLKDSGDAIIYDYKSGMLPSLKIKLTRIM